MSLMYCGSNAFWLTCFWPFILWQFSAGACLWTCRHWSHARNWSALIFCGRDYFNPGTHLRRCPGSRIVTWKHALFIKQLNPLERYREERYRKFAEVLQLENFDTIWPDAARRIARLNSTPAQQVKTVILVQKWSLIIPRADGSYHPGPSGEHVLFGYGVRPGDLQ
jgi:hypothetical protein